MCGVFVTFTRSRYAILRVQKMDVPGRYILYRARDQHFMGARVHEDGTCTVSSSCRPGDAQLRDVAELQSSLQGISAVVSKELLHSTSPFLASEDVCGGGDRLGGTLPVEFLRWLPGYFFSPQYLGALAAVSNELKVAVRDYRQWKGINSVNKERKTFSADACRCR